MARYGKMRSSFDSEGTSLGQSPPPSPPRHPIYYVQSPSRESHDGEKPSFHSTPVMSPMASPMHQAFMKNAGSSADSGPLSNGPPKPGSRRVLPQPQPCYGGVTVPPMHPHTKKGYKQWTPGGTILEEEEAQMQSGGRGKRQPLSRCCMFWLSFLFCLLLLSIGAMIFWFVCQPHNPKLQVKSITFHQFTVVPGTQDGVPTSVLTSNCTVMLTFHNPSKYFGFHVSHALISLLYSELTIGSGEVPKFYQRKDSSKTFPINVIAIKVPLYGAGPSLESLTDAGADVPLELGGSLMSRAYVFWKLVKPKFRAFFTCDFSVATSQVNFLKLTNNKCAYAPPK